MVFFLYFGAALILLILIIAALFFIFFIYGESRPGEAGMLGISGKAVHEPAAEILVRFCPDEMCLEAMLSELNSAKDIKCAFYDLDIGPLISLLREKNAEVVLEDSNSLPGFLTGDSPALMHNKFCVLDNHTVITGSMNPTERDNYYNNNNLLIFRSAAMSKNYLEEFYELRRGEYGRGKRVRNPLIYIGDIKIENYFCPEDDCKLHAIEALEKANSSLYFMTFSFTDTDIGNLLWNKHYQGLDVKGVFEERQISDYSVYKDIKHFSLIDNNKYTMHHKVFIIDNRTVITGSYNPSKNANERNDENMIIIHDEAIAKRFAEEFSKVYHFRQALPSAPQEIILDRILYDPAGSDTGKEIVGLYNIGNKDLNLDYYFLSDNKSTMRLSGILKKGGRSEVLPKFSLKNTGGSLFLIYSGKILDYAYWEGEWDIASSAGKGIIRISTDISESSWVSE